MREKSYSGKVDFLNSELTTIKKSLNPLKYKEGGKEIDLNGDWKLKILGTQGVNGIKGFQLKDREEAYEYLLVNGKVYIYTGKDDEHMGCGFELISLSGEYSFPLPQTNEDIVEVLETSSYGIRLTEDEFQGIMRGVINIEDIETNISNILGIDGNSFGFISIDRNRSLQIEVKQGVKISTRFEKI